MEEAGWDGVAPRWRRVADDPVDRWHLEGIWWNSAGAVQDERWPDGDRTAVGRKVSESLSVVVGVNTDRLGDVAYDLKPRPEALLHEDDVGFLFGEQLGEAVDLTSWRVGVGGQVEVRHPNRIVDVHSTTGPTLRLSADTRARPAWALHGTVTAISRSAPGTPAAGCENQMMASRMRTRGRPMPSEFNRVAIACSCGRLARP